MVTDGRGRRRCGPRGWRRSERAPLEGGAGSAGSRGLEHGGRHVVDVEAGRPRPRWGRTRGSRRAGPGRWRPDRRRCRRSRCLGVVVGHRQAPPGESAATATTNASERTVTARWRLGCGSSIRARRSGRRDGRRSRRRAVLVGLVVGHGQERLGVLVGVVGEAVGVGQRLASGGGRPARPAAVVDDVDDDDGDVVPAAGLVGPADQLLGGLVGVVDGAQDRRSRPRPPRRSARRSTAGTGRRVRGSSWNSSTSTSRSMPSARVTMFFCGWARASSAVIRPSRTSSPDQAVVVADLARAGRRAAGRPGESPTLTMASRSSPSSSTTADGDQRGAHARQVGVGARCGRRRRRWRPGPR